MLDKLYKLCYTKSIKNNSQGDYKMTQQEFYKIVKSVLSEEDAKTLYKTIYQNANQEEWANVKTIMKTVMKMVIMQELK